MLKKINRGLSRKDFDLSRTSGGMYQSPLFGLARVDKTEGENKFGFVISKKISKKAVIRNRVRRILAEAVRNNFNLLEKVQGNFIFLVKTAILRVGSEEIESEVKAVMEKMK